VIIKNRWSGDPIELPDDCPRDSMKVILEWCARRAREGKPSANLQDANLQDANLQGANLQDATGLNKNLTTPLYGLLLQVGVIRAFKLIGADGHGPLYKNSAPYDVGTSHEVDDADTNEDNRCARGLNVATLDWVCKEWCSGQRIMLVEHKRADIAAIPVGSDGKYRVHRLKVVRELDPSDFGLGIEDETKEG